MTLIWVKMAEGSQRKFHPHASGGTLDSDACMALLDFMSFSHKQGQPVCGRG